jgi:hypothetical protein
MVEDLGLEREEGESNGGVLLVGNEGGLVID